jgi:hypothetical protein
MIKDLSIMPSSPQFDGYVCLKQLIHRKEISQTVISKDEYLSVEAGQKIG